jgi:Aspartyl protease/PDZ domain
VSREAAVRRLAVVSLFAALACGRAAATPVAPPAGSPPAPAAASPEPIDTLPLDLLFGRMPFVEVRVAGSPPLTFNLDTGADGELLNARWARELGLRVENARTVEQPGGAIEMGFVRRVSLSIGRVVLRDHTLETAPLSFLEPFVAHRLDGLLGHGFLSSHIVEIDYPNRKLRVYAPTAALPVGPRQAAVPLEIGTIDAFVRVRIGREGKSPVDAKLELDTGSFEGLGLSGAFVDRHAIVSPAQPRVPLPGLAIGGETSGYRTRVPWVEVGRFRIARPVIGVVTSEKSDPAASVGGTLGADILTRFKVILDYPHRRMILEPGPELERPSEADMIGLLFVASGPEFKQLSVHSVTAGSPAERAGLRAGDRILTVDGTPVADVPLERLWRLSFEAGRSVKFGLERAGKRVEVTVVARRSI